MTATRGAMRKLDSLAVHAGESPVAEGFRGTSPAIEPSSAFVTTSVARLYGVFGGAPGVVYSRLANPTVIALEHALAELEGADLDAGAGAVAFGSGMAAIHAAWMACGARKDALVLTSGDCYGSTLTLLRQVLEPLGARGMHADLSLPDAADLILRERPIVVHCEAISNPLMKVADLKRLSDAAHAVGARFVLDATFATPLLLAGLDRGADVVVHSLTKYLGGHGDVTGGACVARDRAIVAALVQHRIVTGAVLSPFDAWLTLRGLRTLALRMQRHCDNALTIAKFLATHPEVKRVHYPGLTSHPSHALAVVSLGGAHFGGMLAFEVASGGRARAMAVLEALELISPATTLGDVASLALHPASTSHRELDASELAAVGIGDDLLRLSVGIEHVDDLVGDLDRALRATA